MDAANNANTLRVGLVADEAHAARLIAAVLGSEGLTLGAQAGMPRQNAAGEAPWFDDERVLLARSEVDALVVAVQPAMASELIAQAVARRKPVWCLPPAGRTFAELAESIRLVRAGGIAGRLATWWESVQQHFEWALTRDPNFRVNSAELYVSVPAVAPESWQADRGRAGGGVLLFECYELLQAALAILGLPESVHAATGGTRRLDPAGVSSEDLVLGILRFANGCLLGIRGARGLPPYTARLVLHGPDYTVRATAERLAIVDADGAVRESRLLPNAWLGQELARFAALAQGEGDQDAAEQAQEWHVAMAAVLEAMYLSARTGHLESPRNFYEVQKWPEPPPGFFAAHPRS